MKTTISVPVTINEIANILSKCTDDELLQFIKLLDEEIGDYCVTLKLAKYFEKRKVKLLKDSYTEEGLIWKLYNS
jgi:hypothetical protein